MKNNTNPTERGNGARARRNRPRAARLLRSSVPATLVLVAGAAMAGVIGAPGSFNMGGPEVDASKLKPPAAGFSNPRWKVANIQPVLCSNPSNCLGAFRTTCAYSHENFDNPVQKSGVKDSSYLQTYTGNTAADYQFPVDDPRFTGNSTCPGGTYNRSLYSASAVIDTSNGEPVHPAESLIYYKHGFDLAPGTQFFVPAPGLRIVSGSPTNTSPFGPFKFECLDAGNNVVASGSSIPNCPVGSRLWASIMFPQCWDGQTGPGTHVVDWQLVNGQRVCPAAFPKPIPKITQIWIYPVVTTANQTTRWRLSSDRSPSVPAGYSFTSTWVNGWDQSIMNRWITNCLNQPKDCRNDLLGDGWTLF
jgi:hypothetical protein